MSILGIDLDPQTRAERRGLANSLLRAPWLREEPSTVLHERDARRVRGCSEDLK
jgi:hypothetical protein